MPPWAASLHSATAGCPSYTKSTTWNDPSSSVRAAKGKAMPGPPGVEGTPSTRSFAKRLPSRYRPDEGGGVLLHVGDQRRLDLLGRVVIEVFHLGREVGAVVAERPDPEAPAADSRDAEPFLAQRLHGPDVGGRPDVVRVGVVVAYLASGPQQQHAEGLVGLGALVGELHVARLEDDERQLHAGEEDHGLERE